jgi:hypothetical protein
VTDIVINVKPVVLSDGQANALDFFRRDKSSVDGELSYDDRAMTPGRPDEFDRTDAAVIRRGMGLDRIRKTVWDWLVDAADVTVLEALPRNVHLADVSEDEYPAIREGIEAALREFVGDGEYRGLTVASKALHLKRPMLMPICDSYAVAVLKIPLKADASKAERVAAGLEASDMIWQAVKDNRAELDGICALLDDRALPRAPVRVLDALLWLKFGGKIRPGRPRPA